MVAGATRARAWNNISFCCVQVVDSSPSTKFLPPPNPTSTLHLSVANTSTLLLSSNTSPSSRPSATLHTLDLAVPTSLVLCKFFESLELDYNLLPLTTCKRTILYAQKFIIPNHRLNRLRVLPTTRKCSTCLRLPRSQYFGSFSISIPRIDLLPYPSPEGHELPCNMLCTYLN